MNSIQPFFSVVTVVLNDLAGLKYTRESVVSQEFRDFEWVVIDGGSSDGTVKFLSELKGDTVRWLSEKDTGIYDAMNKSLNLCEANYVVFLNAGDFFSDSSVLGKVSAHLQMCVESPDILFAGATYVFRSGLRWYREPKLLEKYIWHGLPAIHQATFYKRQRLQNTKYDLSYKFCGDYYLAAKLFIEGIHATYLDLSLVDFTVGGASYCNPISISIEPFLIQKRILNLSFLTRCRSLLKRFYSIIGVYILSIKWISVFRFKKP